jgi:hypothetical protein
MLEPAPSWCTCHWPLQLMKYHASRDIDPLCAIKYQANVALLYIATVWPDSRQRQQRCYHFDVQMADIDFSMAHKRL